MKKSNETELFLISAKDGARFVSLLTPEAYTQLGEPSVLALGASQNGVACGAAVVDFGTGIGDVSSIFIAESFRRQGAGRALIEGLAQFARRMNIPFLQVVFDRSTTPELMPFLIALGFCADESDAPILQISLEALGKMTLPQVSLKKIMPLSDVPSVLLNAYNTGAATPEREGLPLVMSEVDGTISAACLTEKGTLGGFVAVARTEYGLEVSNVYVDPSCKLQLLAMFSFSLKVAAEVFPSDTLVRVAAVTEKGEQLLRHLFQNLGAEETSLCTLTLNV